MRKSKPSVFIGSSVESLPVLQEVVGLLSPFAEVTSWNESDKFGDPGDFFLDVLINAPARFDFAVLVFGPDDVVRSRKSVQRAPRDNVVFELGLFLSHLGRNRTFVIVPTIWKNGLKILSDLSGLILSQYDSDSSKNHKSSLEAKCKKIGKMMGELPSRHAPRGPRGIFHMRPPLEDSLRMARALNRPVIIRNIALDMEATWPLLRELLLPDDSENITWQSLMIDSRAKTIQDHSSETVSVSVARDVETKIQEFCAQNKADFAERRIKFECRTYKTLPILHGFLIDGNSLFFSLCGIKKGKLVGAVNPYIHLESPRHPKRDEAAAHFIRAFEGWFEYNWQVGRRVWPRRR
jgi:hypothetical protein